MTVYENLVEVTFGEVTVRAWLDRDLAGPPLQRDRELVLTIVQTLQIDPGPDGPMSIAALLLYALQQERKVNALSVGFAGNASIIYPEWP